MSVGPPGDVREPGEHVRAELQRPPSPTVDSMSGTQGAVSRRVRRFVAASVCFLVAWQVAAVAGLPDAVGVRLGVYGFVLHAVFGQAYSLVPAYFEAELDGAEPLAAQFPATVLGTLLLAADATAPSTEVVDVEFAGIGLAALGSVLWLTGVAVFVATLLWTIRHNLSGRRTGTGDHNAHRRELDRLANAFVPIALAYLLVGSYATAAGATPLPPLLDGYPPRAVHLLAAGTGGLLVFAVGFRLLPRLLVATPPRPLAWVVLPTGAVGPALLAIGIGTSWLLAGAAVQAVAVVGFALAVAALLRRSDRERVGRYGVGLGALAGVLGILLGLHFATAGPTAALAAVHARLNVLGFLGLTIVGVSYHFYPPAVGRLPGAGDRLAAASIAAIAGGLALEVAGAVAGVELAVTVGRLGALVGSLLVAYVLAAAFRASANR